MLEEMLSFCISFSLICIIDFERNFILVLFRYKGIKLTISQQS